MSKWMSKWHISVFFNLKFMKQALITCKVVLHDDPRISIVMFEVAAWSWPVFSSTLVDESSGSSDLVFVIVL